MKDFSAIDFETANNERSGLRFFMVILVYINKNAEYCINRCLNTLKTQQNYPL